MADGPILMIQACEYRWGRRRLKLVLQVVDLLSSVSQLRFESKHLRLQHPDRLYHFSFELCLYGAKPHPKYPPYN